ncbi:MAG: exodeoxyribonuclease III [Neisseriaceae bacterium]
MKIATWNVNSLKVRLPQVLHWLEATSIDILALQELKIADEYFPIESFAQLGYHAVFNAQKTYNGVALLSRSAPTHVAKDNQFYPDKHKRIIAATYNDLRVINVYAVNGESLDSDKFTYKEAWYKGLLHLVAAELKLYKELLILGDFNIAPSDLDVYEPALWQNKVLCSPAERGWFQELIALGLKDSLRVLAPDTSLYTWWDYRMNAFKRNLGLRIDHILVTPTLLAKVQGFGIEKSLRKMERPSDHAPVWLELS